MSETLKQRLILSLLVFSIVLALVSLYQRETGTDDAWLAEQAYWMAEEGYVRTELFHGMNNLHKRDLMYHKLHIWHGALAYKLFGWSTYVFKSISLLYFLLFIAISYVYLRKTEILKDKTEYYLFYLFVVAMTLNVILAFTYRPDVMSMTFGFASFAALHISIRKHDSRYALVSGVLAGFSVLSHLNGMAFVATGGLMLLLQRKYRLVIWFSVAALICSMLYFIEFRSLAMFSEFLHQMKSSPALREHDLAIWGVLYKLVSFYKPYLHKGSDASYTLLIAFVFWTQRHVIFADRDLKLVFQYFIILVVLLIMISAEFKSLYLIYPAPFAFLLLAALFKRSIVERPAKRWAFMVLLGLFLLTQWGGTYKQFLKRTPHLAETNRQVSLAMGIPEGTRIIAPLTFIFDEIDRYTIQSFYVYKFFSAQGKIDLQEDFFRVAGEDKLAYIILSVTDLYDLGLSNPGKGDRYGRYVYLGMIGPYHSFRLTT